MARERGCAAMSWNHKRDVFPMVFLISAHQGCLSIIVNAPNAIVQAPILWPCHLLAANAGAISCPGLQATCPLLFGHGGNSGYVKKWELLIKLVDLWMWFKAYLTVMSQCVCINGDFLPVLPQGSHDLPHVIITLPSRCSQMTLSALDQSHPPKTAWTSRAIWMKSHNGSVPISIDHVITKKSYTWLQICTSSWGFFVAASVSQHQSRLRDSRLRDRSI